MIFPPLEVWQGRPAGAPFLFGGQGKYGDVSAAWVNLPQGRAGSKSVFKCRKRDVKCPFHWILSHEFLIENKAQPRVFARAAFSLHTAVFR
jgi:hypothetical protein